MTAQRILAIDPGREKCGLAVMDRCEGVLAQAVVGCPKLLEKVSELVLRYGCRVLVMGDGTAATLIQELLLPIVDKGVIDAIVPVNEKNSSREARTRYWQIHPPRGWRKMIPLGLLVPPCAIDDFAAIILAERYFQQSVKRL